MTQGEKELPVYVVGFAASVTVMLALSALGIVLESESLVDASSCFALTSAVFLAGAIYYAIKAIH